MSNPGINRWGLNLFWYNFWYSDKNQQSGTHQDELITKLMYIYIHYGLFQSKSMFLNKYWYRCDSRLVQNFTNDHNLRYFRQAEYRNKVFNEINIIKLRSKKKNTYITKIWILKYQRWLIVNFYCFQPLKTKRNRRRKPRLLNDFYFSDDNFPSLFLIKNKVLFDFYFNSLFNNSGYYSF